MDENLIIQLGSKKNLSAVDVDQNINIELTNSSMEILSYNESSIIDVAQLFDQERQESETYRIYGKIDFLSIINGLKTGYTAIEDFFTPPRLGDELGGLTKNLPYSFDVYLCYPSINNTFISGETYIRNYVVASKLVNSEVFKAGFGRNVYFNYTYTYDFNIDFSTEEYYDSFGFPINELYLHFVYKVKNNGNGDAETYKYYNWINNTYQNVIYTGGTMVSGYTIGQVLMGDVINYELLNFSQTVEKRMTNVITFPYGAGNDTLQFKYNSFVPIKIRDFGDEVITANKTGGTENDFTIPFYATLIPDGNSNYVWRDILPNGYIDPITGAGVDYPFINKRHYVFTNITLPLVPDLDDSNTNNVFSNIKFGPNSKLNTKPNSSLNGLGNRCS
jgi:hypothetical protein